MSENGEIYTAGKNFTLPPAVTAWTNSTFGDDDRYLSESLKVSWWSYGDGDDIYHSKPLKM